MPDFRSAPQRWGKPLLIAAGVLLAWAAIVAATGGFRVEVGPLRISSRNATRVTLAGAVLALMAWRVSYRAHVGRAARAVPRVLRRAEFRLASGARAFEHAAARLAWVIALVLLSLGLHYGSRVAGGADAFGYVSEAELLAHRQLGIHQSFAGSLPWPAAAGSFVPLAYRLGANGVMGPTVAPGLPFLMALARTFSACGPYLVVPLCGGLLVLATFWLGRRVFGPGPALVATALVACSPVVLFESLVAMADVPAAAFWICALAAAQRATAAGTLGAGALAGMAILIRPNLLPLAVFPWLLAICRAGDTRTVAARSARFAAASVPAALVIAFINHRINGSALTSGYGDLSGAFALGHFVTNVTLYSGWWLESQGVAGFVFLAALWPWREGMRREVAILIGYAVSAALLYLFYLPFDAWWYLRFLIPAIPVALLLGADAVAGASRRSVLVATAALIALLIVAATHAVRFARSKDIIVNAEAERRRYLDAAIYLDATLPADAVVLAMQHSGSVRYYTGRLTMRWDVLDAGSLDRAIETFRARGVPAYALIESWEEEDFRRRFARQRTLARLDAGAMARSADGELRLFALSDETVRHVATVIPRSATACAGASPRFIEPGAVRQLATETP